MGRRDDLTALPPMAELARRLRDGRMSSAAVVERCLETIDDRDGELNAFITVLGDQARARAHEADRELARGHDLGPLHGIPVSVKDLIDLEGVATTAASRVRPDHVARVDAPVLARLRAAGVVFIGKCNLHEFAFGTTGEESAFGPTRNPHAVTHMSGGSSSGSAVSVAAGMAAGSVGTDTGGSIRIPASACGVVGLKPTFGELSCEGVVPLGPTLDHVGPLGATVDDVTLLYRAMAGRPSHGPTGDGTRGSPRLAIPTRYFLDVLADEVRVGFEHALDRLRRYGCLVDIVDIPHAEAIAETYRHTVLYEAVAIHRGRLATSAAQYTPGVRQRLELGFTVSDEDYHRAQAIRGRLRSAVDAALSGRQALVLPTLPIPAPPLGSKTVRLGEIDHEIRDLTLRLTQLFDLTGHPAVTLPCGLPDGGLPCGVQLVGHHGRTTTLLALAAAYEEVLARSAS